VNYAVGGRGDRTLADWFLTGNRIMAQRFPGAMPWELP
jgi:hypothetical protein